MSHVGPSACEDCATLVATCDVLDQRIAALTRELAETRHAAAAEAERVNELQAEVEMWRDHECYTRVICGLCHAVATGHAFIDDQRYCHGDNDQSPTCYERAQSRGLSP